MSCSLSRREFVKSIAICAASFGLAPTIFIPKTHADIIPGEIQLHTTDGWNWWSYIPDDLVPGQKANILVNASGWLDDDYDGQTEDIRNLVNVNINFTRPYKMAHIGIAVPRALEYYTIAFPEECFSDSTPDFYRNPHVKSINIIEEFMGMLTSLGFEVNEKVYIEGFSNGYFFAQRMTLLKPNWVAVIAGGGMAGSVVLPQINYSSPGSTYDGMVLPWSLGISNIEQLAGAAHDDEVYRGIHQYIFHGSEGTKNSIAFTGGSEIYSASDVEFIKSEFGDTDPEILKNIGVYLAALGYDNIKTEILPGLKHEYPNDQKQAAYDFLFQYVTRSDGPNNGSSSGGGGCYIDSLSR